MRHHGEGVGGDDTGMESGRNTFWLQAYLALMDSLFLFYAHSRSLFPGVKQEFEHISFVVIVCPLNLEKWTGRFVTQKEIG